MTIARGSGASPITLNVWFMPNAGFQTRSVLDREINEFRQLHEHVNIVLTIIPWAYAWDRLMAVVKQRQRDALPDVIQIGSTWSRTLAYLGALLDLRRSVVLPPTDDAITLAWNHRVPTGEEPIYSVPWFMDVRVLYYRKDVLEAIRGTLQDLESWEGMSHLCHWITRHPIQGKPFYALGPSVRKEWVLMHDLAPWVWGAGGQFLDATSSKAVFHEEPALQGIRSFFNMIRQGIIPLVGQEGLTYENFFTGQFAFQISGTWPIERALNLQHPEYCAEVAEHYGVTLLPAGSAGRATFLGGSHLAVTSFSQHPEEAAAWVRFLTDPTSQLRHARAIGMLPPRYSAFDQLFPAPYQEIGGVFRRSLDYAKTFQPILTLGTVERILCEQVDLLIQELINHRYTDELLRQTMTRAAEETNHVLTLYG
ncbi:MAG: extracellular solute-binding protein [Elusimicrobia bacterium]|nr:extracellular solute-binding protein [Elusimicrobiota bacterium]